MTEQYNFPPVVERMEEALKAFDGELMDTYGGQDITVLRELKGKEEGGITSSSRRLYKADKMEKIVFTTHRFKDKLLSCGVIVWPDDEHALPAYSLYWAESAKGSYYIIDFFPMADCICDIPYMERYLDPLETIYNKGIKYFPEQLGRSTNWFRALMSPYCLTGDFAPSTKDTQTKLMELIFEYLKVYTELWKQDEPRSAEYMKPLGARKDAIKRAFHERDPGGQMLALAVGEELAELSVKVSY
jgi:hypothetical protein